MPKKKISKKSIKKTAKYSVLVISVLIVILSLPAFFWIYFIDRFYPNTYVNGINLGGKTKAESINLITPDYKLPNSLTLTYKSKQYQIPISSLDIKVDKEEALNKGLKIGRSGNIIEDISDIISLLHSKKDVPLIPTLNEQSLRYSLDDISKEINITPINAEFTITNNKVENFALEKEGLEVDTEKLIQEIKSKIFTTTSDLSLEIPTAAAKPKVKASDLNNLGIKELIGTGKSRFTGSISSRIFNINLAATRINNSLIAPNEVFSFNQRIGDISSLSGYKQAYVIENGQTVLGDGGGVCQVSTTLFRAALESGLPIVERHAHAYRVRYYELDSAPGLDATIYTPTVDFKFKNDTGNYILIQTQADLTNLTLTFNFYGTKDGRTAEITKPILTNYQPAPPDLYVDDPTLPAGEIKQLDFAATGINSVFDYTVTKNGEVINHQTFKSIFKPWQAKFARGTKV